MHVDIFTLFPGMFQGPLTESILKRAQERGLLSIALYDIRDATTDKHHIVDDYPYGGGAGMVMKPEPIFTSVESVYKGGPIILLTPRGRLFNQKIAHELEGYWRESQRRKSRTAVVCWSTRTIHVPPSFAAGPCLIFCFRDITSRLPAGAAKNHCA